MSNSGYDERRSEIVLLRIGGVPADFAAAWLSEVGRAEREGRPVPAWADLERIAPSVPSRAVEPQPLVDALATIVAALDVRAVLDAVRRRHLHPVTEADAFDAAIGDALNDAEQSLIAVLHDHGQDETAIAPSVPRRAPESGVDMSDQRMGEMVAAIRETLTANALRLTGVDGGYVGGGRPHATLDSEPDAIDAIARGLLARGVGAPVSGGNPAGRGVGTAEMNERIGEVFRDTRPDAEWPALANDIRRIDGNHDLGAGALAAALVERGWTRSRNGG